MENCDISLKNLYRLLTVNDYPVFSDGVMKEKNKKGLTLVKFWKQVLIYDFRNTNYGKIIWRTEGARNRYHSELCNRNANFKYYNEYTHEILTCINGNLLYRQASLCAGFFIEKQCSCKVLERKLQVYLEQTSVQDEYVDDEIYQYFTEQLKQILLLKTEDEEYLAYRLGWMLMMLMLHAIAGPYMRQEGIARIRNDERYQPMALWKLYADIEPGKRQVRYLTKKNSELCRDPLQIEHFFGREREVFDLRELISMGGKYSISGIGGIGKTELLRQVLKICIREGAVDYIATVQYEKNLRESFCHSFLGLTGKGQEENFSQCVSMLQNYKDKKVLLLIDNANEGVTADPYWEQLLKLPCTIFVTTRLSRIRGFEKFEVGLLEKNAALLIFRDIYGNLLDAEKRKELEEILNPEIYRHTLTLRVLGKAAKSQKWTMAQLREQLEQKKIKFVWRDKNVTYNYLRIYRQLYEISILTPTQQRLLQMFSILPYKTYSEAFFQQFCYGFLLQGEQMHDQLSELAQLGWLEENPVNINEQWGDGYSMHPVIAESIHTRKLNQQYFAPFWKSMEYRIGLEDIFSEQPNAKLDDYAELLLSTVLRFGQKISNDLLLLVAKCNYIIFTNSGFYKYKLEEIEKLYDLCSNPSTEIRMYMDILRLMEWKDETEGYEQRLEEIYRKQYEKQQESGSGKGNQVQGEKDQSQVEAELKEAEQSEGEPAGTGQLEAEPAGVAQLEAEQAGTGQTEAGQAKAAQLEAEQAGTVWTETEQPGTVLSEAEQPGTVQSEMEQDNTLGNLLLEYCLQLAISLNYNGKYEKSEALVHEYLEKSSILRYQIYSKYVLAESLKLRMKLQEAVACMQEGLEQISGTAWENGELNCNFLYSQAETKLMLGDVEGAKQIFTQLEEISRYRKGSELQLLCFKLRGSIFMAENRREEAAQCLEEVKKLTKIYYGDQHYNFIVACASLGIVYNYLGKWKQAVENHQQALRLLKENKKDMAQLRQVEENNLGVAYIDSGRSERAVKHLESAYELAEDMGALAKAEPTYNLARAYRELKDKEKELQYLKEAYPVFLENYGEEHTKTKAVKERLEAYKVVVA